MAHVEMNTFMLRPTCPLRSSPIIAIVLCFLAMASWCPGSSPASIRLEVFTEAGAPLTAAQDWMEVLSQAGFSRIRMHQAQRQDTISVSRDKSAEPPVYLVTGMITRRNQLRLPNGSFSLKDQQGLQEWMERLRQEGDTDPSQAPAAFGLTASELIRLHDDLASPLTYSTRGQSTVRVLNAIRRQIDYPLHLAPAGQRGYAADTPVADELSGVSVGTVLSATLRPLGLVWYPKSVQGRLELVVTDVRDVKESWPVGWPSEQKRSKVLPSLMTQLNVKIKNQPLDKVLQIISSRMKTPILLDHHALARHRIDAETVQVSVPEGRTVYGRILDQILTQCMLKSEVRLDEAGRPFVWVSSVKR